MSEPIHIAIFNSPGGEPRIAITFQTGGGKQVGMAPDLRVTSTLSESEKSSLKSALPLLRHANDAIRRKLAGRR